MVISNLIRAPSRLIKWHSLIITLSLANQFLVRKTAHIFISIETDFHPGNNGRERRNWV